MKDFKKGELVVLMSGRNCGRSMFREMLIAERIKAGDKIAYITHEGGTYLEKADKK